MDNLYKSVLSLEKCKYLLTLLADKPNSGLFWIRVSGPTNNFLVTKTNVEVYEDLNFVEQIIPAFTIIDLLDFLPEYVEKEGVKYYLNTQEFNKRWNITYRNVDSIRYLYYSEDKSLLDCLYNCLLWKLIVYDHKDI
jgi:hypothetical protein